jgi:hypothetical protein
MGCRRPQLLEIDMTTEIETGGPAKPEQVLLARQQINLEKETLDSDLDSRMREAGMMSLSEMLKNMPLQRWLTHTGVNDMESFEAWLRMRRGEMLRMQIRMELDKRQDDEMYEWVISHTAVFTEVLCNFRAAAIGEAKQ